MKQHWRPCFTYLLLDETAHWLLLLVCFLRFLSCLYFFSRQVAKPQRPAKSLSAHLFRGAENLNSYILSQENHPLLIAALATTNYSF
jgi:hypothetical protein